MTERNSRARHAALEQLALVFDIGPGVASQAGGQLLAAWLAAAALCACLLAGCSPRQTEQHAGAASGAPAANASAASASDAADSVSPHAARHAMQNAAASAASSALAATGGSAPIALRRTDVQIKFVQMFEKECLPRIAPQAALSPGQRTDFCQCYAAAMADNNSEAQLARYLAGQDQGRLLGDAEHYGKPCLEQARSRP